MNTELANSSVTQRAREVFHSPRSLLEALINSGYITNQPTALTVYNCWHNGQPILQEGPPGAGKTELANALIRATGMEMIRLQCYEGITARDALGWFDESLQDIDTRHRQAEHQSMEEILQARQSRSFYVSGPLLRAIESPTRCLLLIDEIDKIPPSFEAVLLELLDAWQISIPSLGTVTAKTKPLTILTSNAHRDLEDPLRRRVSYMLVQLPSQREIARIVIGRTRQLLPETHRYIVALSQALANEKLEKAVSISELIKFAESMELFGWTELYPEMGEFVYPMLFKREKDLERMKMADGFGKLLAQTRMNLDQVDMEMILELRAAVGIDESKFRLEFSNEPVFGISEGKQPIMSLQLEASNTEEKCES